MDIAKYIGLFLLKTNYCYIPGLGNLVIKKRPATHDGESLKAPSYEVIVTPGGSIDDSLANFIATNEQISISKAANALREFSTQAKADLNAGKEVIIPSLGKFTGHNGQVEFVTDPHMQYTPPAIPTVKHVAQEHAAAQPKTGYNNPNMGAKQTNWGKIALFILIPVILIVAVVVGMNYMNNQPAETEATPAVTEEPATQQPPVETAPAIDSTAADTTTVAAPPPAANMQVNNGKLNFKLVLNDYKYAAAAEKRATQLTSYGNAVEVVMKDSSTWYVVMPVSAAAADTAHVIDSIRRTFNPRGVSILK